MKLILRIPPSLIGSFLALIVFLLVGASFSRAATATFAGGPSSTTDSDVSIQAFFTVPDGVPVASPTVSTPLKELQRRLHSARSQIDFCMFRLNHREIVEALIGAHRRGVRVRVITDEDYWTTSYAASYEALREAGIELRVDVSPITTVMHNKFVVVDQVAIWTGDWNAHVNDSKIAFHASLYARIPALAKQYLAVFEGLWLGKVPDTASTARETFEVPYGTSASGTTVRPYFPPGQLGVTVLRNAIASARDRIRVAHSYLFNRVIWTELVRAAQRGIQVEILYQSTLPGIEGSLALAGADIRKGAAFVGSKFVLIDDGRLITGSWNSGRFESDIENLLDIKGEFQLVDYFSEYFESAFRSAKPFFSDNQLAHWAAEETSQVYRVPRALMILEPDAPRVFGLRASREDTAKTIRVGVALDVKSSGGTAPARYYLAVVLGKPLDKSGRAVDPDCRPLLVPMSTARSSDPHRLVGEFPLTGPVAPNAIIFATVIRMETGSRARRIVGSYAMRLSTALARVAEPISK